MPLGQPRLHLPPRCVFLRLALMAQAVSCAPRIDTRHLDSGQCQQQGTSEDSVASSSPSLLQIRRHTRPTNESVHSLALIDGTELHHDEVGPTRRGKMYAYMEQQVKNVDREGVVVVIPGLGTYQRATQVEKNIAWLKTQGVPFECFLFVYKSVDELPLKASRFEPCQLIRHPGSWMSHVLELPLNMTSKPWVLHMMDGIEPQSNTNLPTMFRTMLANNLGHAAPTFEVPPQTSYPIMASRRDYSVGRLVDFIEMHFDIFSRKYFACLQDSIDVHNELGWGVDRLLPWLCGGAASSSKVDAGGLGLLDHMNMVKTSTQRLYSSEQAGKQANDFFRQYPNAQQMQSRYLTLGQLKAP